MIREYDCKHIDDCVYRRKMRLDRSISFCDYVSIKKHSRGCDPEDCNKFVRRDSNEGKEILKKTRSSYYLDFTSHSDLPHLRNIFSLTID